MRAEKHEMTRRLRPEVRAEWWRRFGAFGLVCLATAIVSPAQSFTTLVNFNGTDGDAPYWMSLVQGTDGKLYGTTYFGGLNAGTVFKMMPTGNLTTLHSFCSQKRCLDGSNPEAGLVLGTDTSFYGTTIAGGANIEYGTVFKITSTGRLTVLHSFARFDGWQPAAALVQGTDGELYGTTYWGGAHGDGTVFKITTGGVFILLHSFTSPDGEKPIGSLIEGTDGNFYGTTQYGGANGDGTIFRITPRGVLTTLHSFSLTDGANPYAALVQPTNGNFYGTTAGGGASGNGTIFKINSAGMLTTLHSFNGTDGAFPNAPLIQATDGNFYGTTARAGANNAGTVFKITPSGTLTTLHDFDGAIGGTIGGLVQHTSGTLYGTTEIGGTNGKGTVFSLDVGLAPFVKTLPTSGKAGAAVIILGNNLTGSTSVTFNGTKATFTVNSIGTAINTTVPSGATTGKVKVTTPSRTLTSNVNFRVTT